jgi:hypothetical protein
VIDQLSERAKSALLTLLWVAIGAASWLIVVHL